THSMGGAPALQLLADGYDGFAAAVLCAPMTMLFDNPAKRLAVGALAAIACALGGARQPVFGVKEHSLAFEGNVLTSDPFRHQRFADLQAAAPNAVIREPTYGWLKAATDAIDDLHRPNRFARLKTPVRIISAEHDALVCSRDHAVLARRSPLIDVVTIKGALHEIMMERDEFRAQYWAAVDAFFASKMPAEIADRRQSVAPTG
ncbi:MAG: alpha/beta hydrolase, partial [Parvularculaceae bacterium]|nr:alpha/beta hydrolase [Parvularculaceae bacterium]